MNACPKKDIKDGLEVMVRFMFDISLLLKNLMCHERDSTLRDEIMTD
jgi:hypothetical protein